MPPVPAHFQKLVQLVGRAFYTAECPPREENPEAAQGPRKGINVRDSVSSPMALCAVHAAHGGHISGHLQPAVSARLQK